MSLDGQTSAHLDLGDASIKALASLSASIDASTAALVQAMQAELNYYKGVQDIPIRNSGIMPTTGSLYLGLDGPKPGRMRIVKRLVVGGVGWSTAAAGSAIFYVSPSRPTTAGATQMPLADVVDEASGQTTPLPSVAFYGNRQIVLHYPMQLFVEINGGTPNQVYVVGGAVEDWPDAQALRIAES